MITVKSSTKQPIDIYVSQKGVPYSGDFFISITKDGEEVYNKKATARSGYAEVIFPNLFQGNYKFSIETDEGFSKEKDLKAVKSNMGGNNGRKSISIDTDPTWDDNKDELTPKVKEFYDQHRDTIDSLKDSHRMIDENFSTTSKKLLSQVEENSKGVSKNAEEITQRGRDLGLQISTLYEVFSGSLQSQYNDIISNLGEKEQEIKELITTGLQNSKLEYQQNIKLSLGFAEQSINKRIDEVARQIPNAEILAYGVDDTKVGKTTLRSSERIVDFFKRNRANSVTKAGSYFPTSDINDSISSPYHTYSSAYIDANFGAGGGGTWGSITGTLSDQADLQTALDGKADALTSDQNYVTDAQLTIIASTTASFTTAQETKLGHISVTQVVDLDQMEIDIAALANGMVYKGDWDASAGTFPGAGVAQTGRFYYVTVAGTVDGVSFAIGDNIVATVDNASATTYAANWSKHDQTDAVQAVFGRTGSVVATNGDYTASQITNVAAGSIAAVTVQAAIDELDSEKANVTLSNLGTTAINASLIPDSDDSYTLGDDDKRWDFLWVDQIATGKLDNQHVRIQARNNSAYVTMYEAVADTGGTPTANLHTITTIGSQYIYRAGGTDVPVADGGTGLSAIAALSILVANSANTYVALTPAAGESIRINAAGNAWEAYTPGSGGGDVSKVGTPVDNQLGVWTGDGTLEGDVDLTFDTATNILEIGTGSGRLNALEIVGADELYLMSNYTTGGYIHIQGSGLDMNFQATGGNYSFGKGGGSLYGDLNLQSITDNRVYTMPDLSGTVALLTGTQSFSSKTINMNTNTITGTKTEFNTAASDGTFVFVGDTIDASTTAITNITVAMFAANVADTDVTLAANSNSRFATQAAVKAYADGLFASNDAMLFKGVIDCSANPNYPAADAGHFYKISVAGKIGGASGINVQVGDSIICAVDGTAAGNQATVGANWYVVQANIDGAVVGPTSSTDGFFPLFDGTTGKLIKDSVYSPASFQPINSNLTTIAGLTATTDNFLVSVSSAWASRTPAQVRATLDLEAGTDFYSIAAADALLAAKAPLANPTFTGTVILPKTIEIQDTSADHQYVLAVSELTADRTITLPLLTTADEFVFKDHTVTLTNKRITKRVTTAADATSITPNTDNCDITYQANTQGAGTLTINADAGTPTNGQSWLLKVHCTNAQTLSFDGEFVGGTTALPAATTGGGKIDYYSFIYDTVDSKRHYTGSALGF